MPQYNNVVEDANATFCTGVFEPSYEVKKVRWYHKLSCKIFGHKKYREKTNSTPGIGKFSLSSGHTTIGVDECGIRHFVHLKPCKRCGIYEEITIETPVNPKPLTENERLIKDIIE